MFQMVRGCPSQETFDHYFCISLYTVYCLLKDGQMTSIEVIFATGGL